MRRWAWIAIALLVLAPLSACVPQETEQPPTGPGTTTPLPPLPISGGSDTLGKFTWYDEDDNPLPSGSSDHIRDDFTWKYEYFDVLPAGEDWAPAKWFEVRLQLNGAEGRFKITGSGGVVRWIGIDGEHLDICNVLGSQGDTSLPNCAESGLPELPGTVLEMTGWYHDGSDWVEGEVTKVRIKNKSPY